LSKLNRLLDIKARSELAYPDADVFRRVLGEVHR
jgi:hypothetical protein